MAITNTPEDKKPIGLLSQPTQSPAAGIAPAPIEPVKVDTTATPAFEAETVESRLDKLLNKDNAYIKTARANAAEAANQRGLLNSSIAAGSGEKAAIESALPIAQQDASAQNTFKQNEQAFNYNTALQDATAANQFSLTDKQSQNEAKIQEQLFGYNQALSQMNIDADLKLRTTESLQTLSQQYMTERTKILTSPELDEESKQVLLDDLTAYTSQSMALVSEMSGYDVSMFDSFTSLGTKPTAAPTVAPSSGTTGGAATTSVPADFSLGNGADWNLTNIFNPTDPVVITQNVDRLVSDGKIEYPVGWASMTDKQKASWYQTNVATKPWLLANTSIGRDFTQGGLLGPNGLGI